MQGGCGFSLNSEAGCAAKNMEKNVSKSNAAKARSSKSRQAKQNRTIPAHAARSATNPKKKTGPVARTDSKLATVVTMLREPKGKSIDDLMKATGWQAHSVRGAISGAIKKKLGLTVTSEKANGVRVYRISA